MSLALDAPRNWAQGDHSPPHCLSPDSSLSLDSILFPAHSGLHWRSEREDWAGLTFYLSRKGLPQRLHLGKFKEGFWLTQPWVPAAKGLVCWGARGEQFPKGTGGGMSQASSPGGDGGTRASAQVSLTPQCIFPVTKQHDSLITDEASILPGAPVLLLAALVKRMM